MTLEQLGTARKVTVANTSTTLIADAANKEEIRARVAQVRPARTAGGPAGRAAGCAYVCVCLCIWEAGE